MNKRTLKLAALSLILALGAATAFAADNVQGLWKTVDDKTGKPKAYILLYGYKGQVFGRTMATIDEKTGAVKDTTDTPVDKAEKADKIAGNPPYAGMDFVYKLEDKGKEWRGLILDPNSGDEYDCRIWLDKGNLIVRGQLKGIGFIGRNQTWFKAAESDLPPGYKLPDPSTFVPVMQTKIK